MGETEPESKTTKQTILHTSSGFNVETGFCDGLYRPRTLQTMFTFFVAVMLLVYWRLDVQREALSIVSQEERDNLARSSDIRTGVVVVAIFIMMYFALQSRDGVMHRPHPIVWRCVHGSGFLYVIILLFMLNFDAPTVRRGLHSIVSPSLGNRTVQASYAGDCSLRPSNVCDQFFDIFTLAHAMGYVAKALVYRDWYLLWMHSVLFEVVEISLSHLLPNFAECYWDRLFLDVFGANLLGMIVGMYLVNRLEKRNVKWDEEMPLKRMSSRIKKARRIMMQFTPLTWDPNKWKLNENPEHFLAAGTVIIFGLAIETTTFFIKHFLWIDTKNRWLSLIMLLKAALSAHAYREFYVYVVDRTVRIGHNCWLFIVLTLAEVTLSVKWSLEYNFEKPIPSTIITGAWGSSLCLVATWYYYRFRWQKEDDFGFMLGVSALLPLLALFVYDLILTSSDPPLNWTGKINW